jgi:ABC-type sugar transport system ATPase subunit
METNKDIIFEMKNIRKQFPGVLALDDVSFEVVEGEVHALVGENGDGKSTLMKILSGLYHQDSGRIFYKSKEIRNFSTRQVRDLGISTIYQELNLCPNLDVAQNIFLGKEKTSTPLKILHNEFIYEEARKYLQLLDSSIDPYRIVAPLGIAERQIIEIAKALSYECQVIVMDEPTSSLTPKETGKLFELIARLQAQGRSVVFISHRLEEVFTIADRATVLRDGRHIGTKNVKDLGYEEIVNMMVGREIEKKHTKTGTLSAHSSQGEALLEVKNLTVNNLLNDISFRLYPGQVLGFSGIVGAGRTELMEAIFGLRPRDHGEIRIHGKVTNIRSPKDAINSGLSMTSEDRKKKSLFLNFNVRENVTISFLSRMAKSGYINGGKERKFVQRFIDLLSMRPADPEFQTYTMSGGNQQKVVIAKSLSTEPEILIMDEPTRGIDVGAKEEVYKIIKSLAAEGKGIILVSSELPEILSLCDRIIVMNKGSLVGEFSNEEATEEQIMSLSV